MSHTPKIPGINVFDSLVMGGDVKMVGLPTADPEEEDKLWNDNGGIKVSAGSPIFNISTRDTEANILASTPTNPADEVTVAYGTDTGDFYIYDGSAWYVYKDDGFTNTYSIEFDGTNDYMDCSSTFTSLWSGSFSISLWLKTPSSFAPGVDMYLANKFVVGQGNIDFRQRQVSSSTAKIEFYLGNSLTGSSPYGLYGAGTAAILSTNSWYHVVLTADRPASGTTTATLYINGSPTTLTHILGFLSVLPNAGGTWSNNTLIAARNTASSGSGTGELNLDGHLDEMAFFNSVLSASDVSTIYNSGVPDDLSSLSPVNWWRMGDNDGGTGTTITDQGSGGNNGTLINSPTFSTDVPEEAVFSNTYSLSFDGTNDYISVADADNLSFGDASSDSPFTLALWLNSDTSGNVRMITKGVGTPQEYAFTVGSAGTPTLNLYDGDVTKRIQITSQTAITQGVWQHWAVTYDGSGSHANTKIYLNGTAVSTTTSSSGDYVAMHNTSTPVNIGRHNIIAGGTTYESFVEGKIDEVAIFNSALSASDIAAIYNSGAPADLTSYSPVGWWRMGDNDSGTGTTITDQGSGGNNGTLINGPTFSTTIPS